MQSRSVVIKLEFGANPLLRGESKKVLFQKTFNKTFLNGLMVSIVIRHAMLIKTHYHITATARLFSLTFYADEHNYTPVGTDFRISLSNCEQLTFFPKTCRKLEACVIHMGRKQTVNQSLHLQ